jgi:transcriptional regulator with XRE-family HTH domain
MQGIATFGSIPATRAAGQDVSPIRDAASDDFASVLRRFRMNAGLSQEGLAERAGISAKAVSSLERGIRRRPYRATSEALASALRLSEREREVFERARLSGQAPAAAHLRTTITLKFARGGESATVAISSREFESITGVRDADILARLFERVEDMETNRGRAG